MAKKFVRGITGIKKIDKQDLDTNNVNDLLSDGEHNYIHRKKKDKTEEYHNLTNNIKTIEATNNGLLTVKNENNTKNKATLTVHHDPQKEQKLYSTDGTIDIVHGDNGTGEFTNVDVNPKKVLTHDNLVSNSQYVTLSHAENSNTTEINTVALENKISELEQNGGGGQKTLVSPNESITIYEDTYNTFVDVNLEMLVPILAEIFEVTDTQVNGQYYHHTDAFLKTVTKPLIGNESNFYLLLNMNKGKTQASFELTPDDVRAFTSLIDDFGLNNKIDINGVEFTLNGQTLSVNTNNATSNKFVTSFSAVIYFDNSGSGSGGGGVN